MHPISHTLPHFSAAGREVAAHIVAAYDALATHHAIRPAPALLRDGQRGHGDFALENRHNDLLQPPERLQSALLRHRQQSGYAEVSAYVTTALQDTATPEPQRVPTLIATLRQATQFLPHSKL